MTTTKTWALTQRARPGGKRNGTTEGRLTMNDIQHLTDETFAETVAAPGVTVIDFWAGWCGPCRAMAPQFEKAAGLRPQYRFAKVDVDAEPNLAARFQIRSIPTLMVLRDGEPVAAQSGVIPADALVKALDRLAEAETPAQSGVQHEAA